MTGLIRVDPAAASSSGPVNERTGAPAEAGGFEFTCVGCHSTFALDSGPGLLTITAPQSYEPGITYDVLVSVAQAGRVRWGFEMTAIDDLLTGAGAFAIGPDGFTQLSAVRGREYIKHTSLGSADGQPDGNQWSFTWTAPASDIGPVTFYAAGVAANGVAGSNGDDVYSTFAVVPVPEPMAGLLQLIACMTLGLLAAGFGGRGR